MENQNSYVTNESVTSRNTYSASELARLRLPGYPTTRKSWYELAERENWDSIEAPGKGPGGKRREFLPSQAVLAVIRQALVRSAFEAYREQVAAGEPLATAKASFLNDYNARAATVDIIDGVSSLTLEQLDEALAMPRQGAIQHAAGSGKSSALLGVARTDPRAGDQPAGVPALDAPMMAPDDTTEIVSRCLAAAARVMQDRCTPEQHVNLGIDTWGALRRMFHGREAENIGRISDTDLVLLAQFIFNTKQALNSRAK